MRVTVRYDGGPVEELDTDRLTRAEPFAGKSVVADLAVSAGPDGIRLAMDYYDASGVEAGGEAARRHGWTALLASAEEMARIESVDLDGAPWLLRVGGELADVGRLRRACDLWCDEDGSLAARAVWAHDAISLARPGLLGERDGERRLCAELGLSVASYEALAEARTALGDEE